MFNTRTFFGTDGTLTIANQTAMEPDALTTYFGEGNVVGRVVDVELSVATQVRPFHEVGRRLPKELRAGRIAIAGSVERAYVNGALLRLMLGQYATAEEAAGFTIPSFDMKLMLDNLLPPGDPGNSVADRLRRHVRPLAARPAGGRLHARAAVVQGAADRRGRHRGPGVSTAALLAPEELLAGSDAVFDVEIPGDVLRPAAEPGEDAVRRRPRAAAAADRQRRPADRQGRQGRRGADLGADDPARGRRARAQAGGGRGAARRAGGVPGRAGSTASAG